MNDKQVRVRVLTGPDKGKIVRFPQDRVLTVLEGGLNPSPGHGGPPQYCMDCNSIEDFSYTAPCSSCKTLPDGTRSNWTERRFDEDD